MDIELIFFLLFFALHWIFFFEIFFGIQNVYIILFNKNAQIYETILFFFSAYCKIHSSDKKYREKKTHNEQQNAENVGEIRIVEQGGRTCTATVYIII